MSAERIFADTNLFLRYLTNDIPEKAEAFDHILHRAAAGDFQLVTNSLVLAEIIWTLESFYKMQPVQIQAMVLAMLNTPGLEIVDGDIVLQAILWYVEKNIDFIDAFNVAWIKAQGIDQACTFDKKHFARFEGVTVRSPGE